MALVSNQRHGFLIGFLGLLIDGLDLLVDGLGLLINVWRSASPRGGFLQFFFFFLLVVFMVAVSCDCGCLWWFLAIFCVSFPLGGCFLWLLLVVSLVVVAVTGWWWQGGHFHVVVLAMVGV